MRLKTTYFLVMPENLQNSFKWVELIGVLRAEMPMSDAALRWLTNLEIPGMMFWLLC